MSRPATIALIMSLDTKGAEAAFMRERLTKDGIDVVMVDFGTDEPAFSPDVSAETLARLGGASLAELRSKKDRASAIEAMMQGAAAWSANAYDDEKICGVVSVGGSGGTAVGTAAMRAIPFGAPKIMVSTVAASDTRAYVGAKDITMINSVVDFAGLNPISEPVLRNAAAAAAAMARACLEPGPARSQRLVACTQFGVTTQAVEAAAGLLADKGFALVPFHATGVGGKTMESLISEGMFDAVLDLTTTEWADEVAGGNLSAGPERLDAAARAGIPQVVAPGALDMANFFMVPVPDHLKHRTIFQHNANVALMRTTAAENAELGRRIAEKLNAATGPIAFLYPRRGFSALDAEGKPFFDPEADAAFLDALKSDLASHVVLRELDLHINDPQFAAAAVETLLNMMNEEGH